jgi:signal transduction histidine kinase
MTVREEDIMQMDRPLAKKLFAMRHELVRGDSLFAVMIFTVVALFLFNLGASLWHNCLFVRDVKEQAGFQHVKAVGSILARAVEALMGADELSVLRRTIAEAGMEHKLQSCRVVLPDGGVLADADPGGITAITLPASWEGPTAAYAEKFSGNSARFTFPLTVPGRGSAALEITAGFDERLEAGLAPQTAQMAIACLALASVLLVHRHARFRLKAIGAIHEILLAVKDDGVDISALELDPHLGLEAVAWNRLLGERRSRQVSTAIQRVKEAVHERSASGDTLVAAFDTVPCGLVLVNDKLQVEHVNGAAAVFLQADRERLHHADVATVVKDEQVTAAIRAAVENSASKRVVVEIEQGGSVTSGVLRYTIAPTGRGEARFVLVTIEDVTQQRVAEAAMNSFLAKAAHELRTPLTNIRLFVEEALEHCERDPAGTSRCLNIMNEEAQRLDRTVSEILSVSQIEAGSFELKRDDVSVEALLTQLKADHEAQARERRITLEFDQPPKLPIIQADRDKIALALHNLVGNALKYTLEGGHVTVVTSVENSRLTVAVTDTGIGIGAEESERVFEKFYRSKDPQAAAVKGSGLGLPIAREVARLHGGDVTLESELGKGSTFTLILPPGVEAA